MQEQNITELYNYNEFTPEKFERWMNFSASPPLGKAVPNFPLCHLDGAQTILSQVISQALFTVVEFGSFT